MTMIYCYSQKEGWMPGRSKKSIHEIAISEFKAKCLSLLEEVSKTKTPLRVTRRGKAVADVIPASLESEERDWIGSMSESVKITGDIISPVIETQEIEALKQ
jgi:prevent-host-death family protein